MPDFLTHTVFSKEVLNYINNKNLKEEIQKRMKFLFSELKDLTSSTITLLSFRKKENDYEKSVTLCTIPKQGIFLN